MTPKAAAQAIRPLRLADADIKISFLTMFIAGNYLRFII